ncbi:T3SS effector NleG [Salmonella enterica subsp. salamae]|nr:T3SS effector NleG [Salmonella enterica subsp. salamae]EEF0860759.1 DUF1076 domain-containing protein [Salmonella enterica subsp. salamae]
MLFVMKQFRRTIFLTGRPTMPGINLAPYINPRGELGVIPQDTLEVIRNTSMSTPEGADIQLGGIIHTIRHVTLLDSFLVHLGRNIDGVGVVRDSDRNILNSHRLSNQLNNRRVYERSSAPFSTQLSGGHQRVMSKIVLCSFNAGLVGFQVPGEHLTCPITLSIPERGVFSRTSLQSDVCCLYDSTALKELVSRRLPHPMSREAITGAHIVPKEQCHFDQEKGAFIHSASESR